jgi:hypothetical protein
MDTSWSVLRGLQKEQVLGIINSEITSKIRKEVRELSYISLLYSCLQVDNSGIGPKPESIQGSCIFRFLVRIASRANDTHSFFMNPLCDVLVMTF